MSSHLIPIPKHTLSVGRDAEVNFCQVINHKKYIQIGLGIVGFRVRIRVSVKVRV